ncbi:hypothetical protein [Streptomyces sp. ERV7]|uniref:hypothetical protein n=1 Tax=Streptomyces sp. ERV7 TaxID=1322334 RepID=UPI000B0383DB|nr:hypothetical protein [Streptomyces sp. ERV7]
MRGPWHMPGDSVPGARLRAGGWLVAQFVEARVLPVPPSARRPASVLDHREEGPDGQLALL